MDGPAGCQGTGLSPTFYAFVAVFIVLLKVVKKLLIGLRHFALLRELYKEGDNVFKCGLVRIVLMSLSFERVWVSFKILFCI